MSKKAMIMMAAVAVISLVSQSYAEQTPISLEECLSIAWQRNFSIAEQEEGVTQSIAEEKAAFRAMLPKLSVTTGRVNYLRTSPLVSNLANSNTTTATISQPVYQGGSLMAGWDKTKLAYEQALLQKKRAYQILSKDVKTAWYGLLEAQMLLEEAEASLERLKEHERIANAFYREGRYWRNEVLQAQVEVARGEQTRIQAKNQVILGKAKLNLLLRHPLNADLAPDGNLNLSPKELQMTMAEATEKSLQERPDLQSLHMDIDAGRLNETVVQANMLPAVTFDVSWSLMGQVPGVAQVQNDTVTKAALQASWNAWDWGKTNQTVQAAKAGVRKSDLKYQETADNIRMEVKQTFIQVSESMQMVEVLRKSLEQSMENYRVNKIRYREQLGSATDVLDAQRLLTETKSSYISSLKTYLTAMAALDAAVGKGEPHIEQPKLE